MSQPIIGYLDPAYFDILDEVSAMLARVFITKQTTMTVAGAGSAGMEAGLSSLLERGDKAIICVNGFFCERQILMCERLGIEVARVEAPYGSTVDPQSLEDALRANPDNQISFGHPRGNLRGNIARHQYVVGSRSRPRCVVHDRCRYFACRNSS